MGKEKLGKTTSGLFVARARVGVGLLFGFFALLCFSNPASAASYLNVSSGSDGDVSFGKVSPNATGVSATATDTLTINTNCSVGYSVYVSAQSGKGTSLVNTDPNITTNNTIATSSAGIGSAAVLSNNTWGLSADSTSATTGQYVGLPTYANALNTPLTIMSDVAEQSTVPIYYGLKVTTALAPGTYTGDILYTVLASPACDVYAIHFNANGGTGTMNNQVINVGSATALSANTFTRSGYAFLGWSNSATGKTGTASNGIGTMADVDYVDGQSVTDIADFNTTKDLYAIWASVTGNMQSWTGCNSLSTGQSVYLMDTRDNKAYTVKKLPDGKCWMMQNLTIGMDGAKTLTPADTNIDDGKTYYLPPAGKQGSSTIDDSSTLTATDTANFTSSTDQHAKTRFRTKNTSITNDSDTGYYNFYTATLGYSYYNDSKTSGSSTRDICPKGWRLPKTTDNGSSVASDSPAEFTTLAKTYNPSASWTYAATSYSYSTSDSTITNSMYSSAASPLATSTQNNYAGFSYAGHWNGTSTSASSVGSYGRYWSSSVYSTASSYYLRFSPSSIYPQDYYNKYYGVAVRCVAQDNYTLSYSADGGSGSASKTSETVFENETTITMPTQGTLSKTDYDFKGWALTSSAATAAYSAGASVSLSTLLSDAATAGQTTTSGSTITLYAVWELATVYFQTANSCSTITVGTTGNLVDSRDNQEYTVYRWPNTGTAGTAYPTDMSGYCLMTKDLSLGYVTGGSVTKGANLTLTTDNSAAAATITARTGTGNWSTTNSNDNKQYINGTDATYGTHSYYSYGAAQAVCPKGWRLPTNAEYGNIATFMGGDNSTGSSTIRSAPYSFVYGGRFDSSGWYYVGSYGRYWSSTQGSSTNCYTLTFNSSNLYTNFSSKNLGMSVRCVSAP